MKQGNSPIPPVYALDCSIALFWSRDNSAAASAHPHIPGKFYPSQEEGAGFFFPFPCRL